MKTKAKNISTVEVLKNFNEELEKRYDKYGIKFTSCDLNTHVYTSPELSNLSNSINFTFHYKYESEKSNFTVTRYIDIEGIILDSIKNEIHSKVESILKRNLIELTL